VFYTAAKCGHRPSPPLPRETPDSEREKLLLDSHRQELEEARSKAQELQEASARAKEASPRGKQSYVPATERRPSAGCPSPMNALERVLGS